ncbi:MAG: YIP1 family protein [Lachnospiraceae bacterium]|nr:YIP1 family protein [Lachnospiraceae bacterium]
MLASLKKKETYENYWKSLKFSLYCMTHPMDGYWDLTHEKRGSIAAANTILFLTVLARLLKLQYTSFIFCRVYWEDVNIFLEIATVLFPLALWCVGNWALTTLFEGKGRMSQIYMATCYALVPYPLIQFPLIIFSNVVTVDEAEFYSIVSAASLVIAVLLILAAMMQIHEYKMGKTIFFALATLFAMLVEVFILLLFFSMIGQGISYFISMGREIIFRVQ